jgi:NAD(P)-dependent dehydrogenase (short-subunit alcohol dehydrogenase family)
MHDLTDRVAVVTGAAPSAKAGLGSAFALALGHAGATVVACDVQDAEPTAEGIRASGGEAVALRVDVASARSIESLMADVDARFGRLDILVNCAGVGSNIAPVPLETLSIEAWDELMAINVRGPFLCTQAAVAIMRRASYGKIINLGSVTALDGLPERLHYVTSKGAIAAMTRALARELGPLGIRVNTLAPGLVMNEAVAAELPPAAVSAVLARRALPAHVLPEPVAEALLYLAGPGSDAITGQTLIVDNGGILI